MSSERGHCHNIREKKEDIIWHIQEAVLLVEKVTQLT